MHCIVFTTIINDNLGYMNFTQFYTLVKPTFLPGFTQWVECTMPALVVLIYVTQLPQYMWHSYHTIHETVTIHFSQLLSGVCVC